ncbi:DUF917 domain-containing protein [Lentzea flava]|uniref:DUF917 domain-containing protein n=1 Tax=Lentzea flava TaxID=103732 RepID=A0ABQ2UGT9_9PSEU|nr:DUF917 domain-containing protein [Lentzea flava]MCP2198560.1 hypothetical protein [Lentzea flava]GGU26710.1 hypothetical protein GCM10010178_18900 [Lentzea flava]
MREIGAAELRHVARGAAILGTGGGGDPYIGRLVAEQALLEYGPVLVAEPHEVPDDALVAGIGMIGAPTVMIEKLPAGEEAVTAFLTLQRELGRSITHVLPIEVGGMNSLAPFPVAASLGLPVLDADCMGRAFPMVQMVVCTLDGVPASPLAIADEKGNAIVVDVHDNNWAERLARSATIRMGCTALLSGFPMSGKQARDVTIPGTLTLASRLGRLVEQARREHVDPCQAIASFLGGRVLFTGKVVDVMRARDPGFAKGEARIEAHDASCRLEFQNEHLVASRDGEVLASVPDLICVLDEQGEPVPAERLRYGQRVAVVGAPCHPRWRTPEGLALVGPAAFGYSHEYRPLGV